MKPTNDVYLNHIHDAVSKVEEYVSKNSFDNFLNNEWDQAAVIRHLEIIGEAASHIDDDFKNGNPEIPWRRISDFRNVLVHEYFNIDVKLVWKIIEKDIPVLKNEIEKLLKILPGE